MTLRSAGSDPATAPANPPPSVFQTATYDATDTDDPNHQDHGVASFNVLLNVCLHLDTLKPEIENFLLTNGINNVFEFMGLTPEDISSMMTRKRKPPGADGQVELETDEISLPGVVARALTVLYWYVHWLYHTEFKGQDVIWSKLTRKHYNEFRTRHYRAASSVTNPNDANGTKPIVDHLYQWKKGVRRDTSAFPNFTDEKQWDNWARTVEAEATMQHVDDVLDPSYCPTTRAELAVFREHNHYMYAIFNRTVLTSVGATIVREHAHDKDAQAIYMKLVRRAKLSTKATLDSETLMAYVTTARVGTWHGTTHNFVLHWLEQVRLLHAMLPLKDHVPHRLLLMLLKAAVREFDLLASTENCAEMLRIVGIDDASHELAYDSYVTLLMSSCTTHDSKYLGKSSRRHPGRRSANRQSLDYEPFDVYTDVDTVSVHMSRQSSHDPDFDETDIPFHDTYDVNLNRQQWQALDKESQELWDKLTPAAKNIITAREPRRDNSQARPPPGNRLPGARPPRSDTRPPITPTRFAEINMMSVRDITAHLHALEVGRDHDFDTYQANQHAETSAALSGQQNTLLALATGTAPSTARDELYHGELAYVLGPNSTKPSSVAKPSPGIRRKVNFQTADRPPNEYQTHVTYITSQHQHNFRKPGSMIDRGANGGVAGQDSRKISGTGRTVNVTGINDHQMPDLEICTVGGVINTQRGPVIGIMNQYAYSGTGNTIHSSVQMESYTVHVNEKSRKIGGTQSITTPDGYAIPLNIVEGLPYMKMRQYTDREWKELPHVILTSDSPWDPSYLDDTIENEDAWFDAISDLPSAVMDNPFDEVGDYRDVTVSMHFTADFYDPLTVDNLNDVIDYCTLCQYEVEVEREHAALVHALDQVPAATNDTADKTIPPDPPPADKPAKPGGDSTATGIATVTPKAPAYDRLSRLFAWSPPDIIKRTFEATTQYARIPFSGTRMKKMFRSSFPACNVSRRSEPVCTDTVFSDTPAIYGGETSAQLFVGKYSLVSDAYGMKTDKQFVNTLQDNIRQRGAMEKLISDRAQVEISYRVNEILRALCIQDWQSEPYHQHQNFAERHYQKVKDHSNRVMDRSGAPPELWLHCLKYVCFVLNHLATESLDWRTPLEYLTGTTPDISVLLRFSFWERVYFKIDEDQEQPQWPSDTKERAARVIGISDSVGHAMTYTLLTEDTKQEIHRSRLRTADDESIKNVRVDTSNDSDSGEKDPLLIRSKIDQLKGETTGTGLVEMDPSDLIGRTFLKPDNDSGESYRVEIVSAIIDREAKLSKDPARVKFICSVNHDEYEEIVTYNELLNHVNRGSDENEIVWKFRKIIAHQGPLSPHSPHYKGSRYNVLVDWESGEKTYEPMKLIVADDPVTLAIYAKENDLLDEEGWRQFKPLARRQKMLTRMINQSKLRSFRTARVYMYGFEVPRNHNDAMNLDGKFKNTRWTDAETLETEQLHEYETFHDLGKGAAIPEGYKKIRVHMVYAVKHDGRHKARLVAGGHLTDVPIDSVYSGVVSLRGIRLVIFLAELNGLKTFATDIGNAYLEARTSERVAIIAGPEFGPLEGHTLIIYKALYGLRSSGLRWHEKFADTLRNEGFMPSKAEGDIWMRHNEELNVYEYIAVYVDDLAMAMQDPQTFCDILTSKKYSYKLKGTGPISYHLGCEFFRDSDGVLYSSPRKYVDKMVDGYVRMYGEKPCLKVTSPLEKGDHPELDTSELLGMDDIKKYQSMIGAMQWAISLGRLDVTTAVMTLSGYRVAPRKGHLERAQRVYGFLYRYRDACLPIRVNEPDYSGLSPKQYDWMRSVYGDVTEGIPKNAPIPLGNFVTTTTYVDANLYHDMITGRSVTGIIHLLNQTTVDWYSRKQATVETATYGSEFVAARTATDQILDLRLTLRYLGVPIRDVSYMFGDNKSVVDSSIIPHAKLHKRHNALSFHRVREAIASGAISFFHIDGDLNPADILSKHWGNAQVKKLLKVLLYNHIPDNPSSGT